MMLYISTKFEKISKTVSELLCRHNFHTKIYKGHNFILIVDEVTVFEFYTSSDDALFFVPSSFFKEA